MSNLPQGECATRTPSLDVLGLLLATAAGRIAPGMTEAQAEEVATATAWDQDEDEEGYVETLAQEAEARQEHRFYTTYGPFSDF